ncbi:hypothetical protein OS493_031689 [Desmophyllum pertusum]|uniref:Uncharacterized protein n=1 Tax=Desmophyllum pertusum TaxID=174260 RepID=A0A9X0D938_9CNID|nr:hypothetical protein OS493_031689 [Desmophyllum pertusum]
MDWTLVPFTVKISRDSWRAGFNFNFLTASLDTKLCPDPVSSLDETEDRANQLLLKLERNLKSYKVLLEKLQEASKEDEAKIQRLENEMEEFSILELDGDETICDLKLLLRILPKENKIE